MKLGANEPKKVALLGVLLLAAGYLVYSNVVSQPGAPKAPRQMTPAIAEEAAALPAAQAEAVRPGAARTSAQSRLRSDEFHPVLHSKRAEERIDPETIDPTLRLDLLAKLQEVEAPPAWRNLFQTGSPPVKADPLKGPEPKVIPKPVAPPAEPPKPAAPTGPPPLNIGLKYYGFSSPAGSSAKTAFFLDGDDILVAKEGETVKRRYRVVRIGVNSVVMEDTESKRQQTIPLAEEAG